MYARRFCGHCCVYSAFGCFMNGLVLFLLVVVICRGLLCFIVVSYVMVFIFTGIP